MGKEDKDDSEKGSRTGEPLVGGQAGRDRPSPSLAGRVFRISGMLGMGLLP